MASASVIIPSQAMFPATWYSIPVQISSRYSTDSGPKMLALGPGAGEQPGLAGIGKPALRRMGFVLRCNVGCPVVLPDRLERLADVFFGQNVAQSDLVRPALPKQLVGQAAVTMLMFGMLLQIDNLNEILVVEQLLACKSGVPIQTPAGIGRPSSVSPISRAISSPARRAPR